MQTSKGHEDIMTTWGFIDLFFSLVASRALKDTVWTAVSVSLLDLSRIHVYGLVHMYYYILCRKSTLALE